MFKYLKKSNTISLLEKIQEQDQLYHYKIFINFKILNYFFLVEYKFAFKNNFNKINNLVLLFKI